LPLLEETSVAYLEARHETCAVLDNRAVVIP
jgi:hypothetical protein